MTRNLRLGIAAVIVVIVCFTMVFNQMSANPAPGPRLLKVKPGELFTGNLKRNPSKTGSSWPAARWRLWCPGKRFKVMESNLGSGVNLDVHRVEGSNSRRCRHSDILE